MKEELDARLYIVSLTRVKTPLLYFVPKLSYIFSSRLKMRLRKTITFQGHLEVENK